jgi:hypothetical protein
VPIRDDATVAFAAIDIDDHGLDLSQLDRDLQEMDVPAVVCRTKSGGAHVYLFFSEPAPANRVRAFLGRLTATLGYPDAEVFPKQDALQGDDIGNWINLPYHGGDRTVRYAVRDGDFVPVAEFLDLAESQRTTIAELEPMDLPAPEPTEQEWKRAAQGVKEWTVDANSGLVTAGREKYMHRQTLELFWELFDQEGEPPTVDALADAVWERFAQNCDTESISGQGHHYRRKDAVAKAKSTRKKYDNGNLPKPGQAPSGVHLTPGAPLEWARAFLADRHQRGENLTLRYHRGGWYAWDGACWPEVEEQGIRTALYAFLDDAVVWSPKLEKLVAFRPRKGDVDSAIDALRAVAHLSESYRAPCWVGVDGPPPSECLPCRNGILHLPARRLMASTPALFTHNALDYSYDPDATTPEQWHRFLADVWPDDAEARDVLQEMFGYLLTPDTSYQKMFLMVGPPRSGKGTIGRVLSRLVGEHNVVGPTLNSLGDQFGLQPLMHRQLALVVNRR